MTIIIRLDRQMAEKKVGLGELAEAIGVTPANLSVLKNGKAKGVRFSTLEPICEYLQCQPGDLIEYVPDDELDAVFPQQQTQKALLGDLLDRAFGGSPGNLVLQALEMKESTPEELNEIRQMLDKLEGHGA